MTLSVVALFCDRDVAGIPLFLENIEKSLKGITHEVILVDNRNNQTQLEIPNNVKIISYGRNVYLWEGRKLGFMNSKGKYIWFCDMDDKPLPVREDFFKNRDEDLITFNSFWIENGVKKYCAQPYNIQYTASDTCFFNRTWQKMIKNAVWNKFYKRTVLEKVYLNYPMYMEIVFTEDMLLNALNLISVNSIRFSTEFFYEYNYNTGDSVKEKYTSIEPIERLLTGFDTTIALMDQIMSKECQESTGIKVDAIYYGSFLFIFKKYDICIPEIRADFLKLMKKYFDRDYIFQRIDTVEISEESKAEIKKLCK